MFTCCAACTSPSCILMLCVLPWAITNTTMSQTRCCWIYKTWMKGYILAGWLVTFSPTSSITLWMKNKVCLIKGVHAWLHVFVGVCIIHGKKSICRVCHDANRRRKITALLITWTNMSNNWKSCWCPATIFQMRAFPSLFFLGSSALFMQIFPLSFWLFTKKGEKRFYCKLEG